MADGKRYYHCIGQKHLLSLVFPIDAIPDFLPFLGLTDGIEGITSIVDSLSISLKKHTKKNQERNKKYLIDSLNF